MFKTEKSVHKIWLLRLATKLEVSVYRKHKKNERLLNARLKI